MSPHDETAGNLAALRDAGFPVDALPDGQREVLAGLSADEVAVLTSVKERMDAHAPEVEAHSAEPIIGGVLF
ncbi:hypothetical protein GCM10027168_06340 [Streptomyces capparidis]|jgi:hypothetical protein